jgi:hypothetical protein
VTESLRPTLVREPFHRPGVIERGYEGLRREGLGERVRGRADAAVVEGEAARLDFRRGPLARRISVPEAAG